VNSGGLRHNIYDDNHIVDEKIMVYTLNTVMYGFRIEDKVTDRRKCKRNTKKESLNDIHEGIKLMRRM
jgi:hypothetical protein